MVQCSGRSTPRLSSVTNIVQHLPSFGQTPYPSITTCHLSYVMQTTALAAVFEKLRLSTKQLEQACSKFGLRINADKCKVISNSDEPLYINDQIKETAQEFFFLGSVVPGTESDVKTDRTCSILLRSSKTKHMGASRHLTCPQIEAVQELNSSNCYICF